MIIKYLMIVLLINLVNVILCRNNVPVLLWSTGSELSDFRVSALKKLSTAEFYENFLKKIISNDSSIIALFVEESLSLEDLRWQDANGNGLYPLIQKQMEAHNFNKFIPYVNNPVKVLQSLTEDNFKVSSFDSKHLSNASRTVFLIELNDVKDDEDRPELLRRHDQVIYETCELIEKSYGKTICILTSDHESWIEPEYFTAFSRKLLQSDEDNKNTPQMNVYYLKDFAMVYTKTPPELINLHSNTTLDIIVSGSSTSVTKDKMILTVSTSAVSKDKSHSEKVSLKFNFSTNNVTWQLENIAVLTTENKITESVLTPSISIGSSIGYSFHTPSKVVFQNQDYKLIFNTLQIELFNGNHKKRFSVADDTVTFFTIPILSGLFVTGLLMTIVLIGLSMIFDIKTMDLFDDPKGKTVTINASE